MNTKTARNLRLILKGHMALRGIQTTIKALETLTPHALNLPMLGGISSLIWGKDWKFFCGKEKEAIDETR